MTPKAEFFAKAYAVGPIWHTCSYELWGDGLMRLFVSIFLIFLTNSAFSQTLDLSRAQSSIVFVATGRPAALLIKGVAKGPDALSGKLVWDGRTLNGTATLRVAALDTGIALRDEHLREKYLEVAKHPIIDLIFNSAALPPKEGPVSAELSLHGKRSVVSGTGCLDIKEQKATLEFEFEMSIKDFAIEIPSYLGIQVANSVQVKAKAEGLLQ